MANFVDWSLQKFLLLSMIIYEATRAINLLSKTIKKTITLFIAIPWTQFYHKSISWNRTLAWYSVAFNMILKSFEKWESNWHIKTFFINYVFYSLFLNLKVSFFLLRRWLAFWVEGKSGTFLLIVSYFYEFCVISVQVCQISWNYKTIFKLWSSSATHKKIFYSFAIFW